MTRNTDSDRLGPNPLQVASSFPLLVIPLSETLLSAARSFLPAPAAGKPAAAGSSATSEADDSEAGGVRNRRRGGGGLREPVWKQVGPAWGAERSG